MLVGVTHEGDYPAETSTIPKFTRSNTLNGISSREIDSVVASALETEGALYELNLPLLEELQPGTRLR
jgi:hypothetical protein